MRCVGSILGTAVLLCLELRADVTIRYKADVKSAMPIPLGGMREPSRIQMKGTKGVSSRGGTTMLVDFAKQEVTMMDSANKRFATIPAAEYSSKIAGTVTGMGAGAVGASFKTGKVESRLTGRKETILGVEAEERETSYSSAIQFAGAAGSGAPGSGAPGSGAAGMPAMEMTVKTVIWSPTAQEELRVPAIRQLTGFAQWQKYFLSASAMVGKLMPGMGAAMEQIEKNQTVMLRSTTEVSMNLKMPGGGPGMGSQGPMMTMTQEVVELSTAALEDELFQIPADYRAEAFEDLMKDLVRDSVAAGTAAMAAEAKEKAAPVPANVKAYVPALTPLTQVAPRAVEPGSEQTQGFVDVLVTVGPNGKVEQAEVLSGAEPLRKAAVEAVNQWTFRPVIRDGAAVTAYTTAAVNFYDRSEKAAPPDIFRADFVAAGNRKAALQETLPRTPQQVLADLEQDAGGGEQRRKVALGAMADAALKAGADEKAAQYAQELLSDAAKNPKGWNYGNAIHEGHMTLGLVALRKDDVPGAREQLLGAGKTPGSPQLDSFGPNMVLANELLKKGERGAVLEYFGLCRKFWKMGGERLDAWSETVRRGETPVFGANLR